MHLGLFAQSFIRFKTKGTGLDLHPDFSGGHFSGCLVATPGNMAKFVLNQNLPGECTKWSQIHIVCLCVFMGIAQQFPVINTVATWPFPKAYYPKPLL